MVIALVRPAIVIAQQVWKNRKTIYAVLTAQDRYISSAFRYGGYGKATSYGVRSGALAGSIAGAFISNQADESPGNGIQTKLPIKSIPGKPYKTRGGQTGRPYSRKSRQYYSGPCRRQSRYRKY